jgi:inner membrane protein
MALDAHWLWLAGGIALLAMETLLPGVFLFWIGLAATATGLVLWAVPLGLTAQLIVFAGLGLAAILVGRQVQGRQKTEVTDAPFLNERSKTLLGQVLPLEAAITNGTGAVRIGDSVWRVTGADLPAGARVRVVGIDGSTLQVEGA